MLYVSTWSATSNQNIFDIEAVVITNSNIVFSGISKEKLFGGVINGYIEGKSKIINFQPVFIMNWRYFLKAYSLPMALGQPNLDSIMIVILLPSIQDRPM